MNGLRGLTSQDRASWEKQYADNIKGLTPDKIDNAYYNHKYREKLGDEGYEDFKRLPTEERAKYVDSLYAIKPAEDTMSPESSYVNKPDLDMIESIDSLNTPEEVMKRQENEKIYNNTLERTSKWVGSTNKALEEFEKTANTISPYFKKFKGTEYLPLDENTKLQMIARYQADKDTYGEQSANIRMQQDIQRIVSKNQPIMDKLYTGFSGAGAFITGQFFQGVGLAFGLLGIAPRDNEIEAPDSFEDYLDRISDNDFSRFGNSVVETGSLLGAIGASLDDEGISGSFKKFLQGAVDDYELSKETGISSTASIRTPEEENGSIMDNILSVNTIPELTAQAGFTVGSMLSGAGMTAVSNRVFSGIKGATIAFNRGRAVSNLTTLNNSLQTIQKAQQYTNAFVIPGAVGWVEGAMEGLQAKIDFLDDAKEQIAQAQAKAVDDRFKQMLANPEELSRLGYNPQDPQDIERLYNDVFQSYAPEYEDAIKKAEENGVKVNIYTTALNSGVNGILNTTVKSGIQTPEVQEALRRSRLGRILTPSEFRINSSGSVVPAYGNWKKIVNVAQEPLGEFTEEYAQSVISAFTKGGATNNLATYLYNKHLGEGEQALNESIADDFMAASKAAGESMIDKQTILAGIYGALSSGMGTPTINNRRGPAVRMQDESKLAYGLRRSPITYRNPIFEAIKDQKREGEERTAMASVINDWMQDSENRERYNGLIGTLNWARQMDEAANKNDEFEYRNSALGKTINDALMLSHLQGTQYYNSFMTDVSRVANIESDSPEAGLLVQQFRAAPSNRDVQQSDEEVLETIKKNANKLLDTMSTIDEESGRLDKMLGNAVDDDTKQALIYGKMSINNWRERATQLEEELGQAQVTPSTQSNIPNSLKELFIKYGSIAEASRQSEKLGDQIMELNNDIVSIKERKNILGDLERGALKIKEAKLKVLRDENKKLRKQLASSEETQDVLNAVLNEQDIMQLNPEERAIILNPENKSKYSQAQQDIIDNLIAQGTSVYEDFSNKVQDAGRINIAQRAYLTQYNSILSDPDSFNAFTQKIKRQVADDNAKNKYRYLGGIEDYSTFVKELDKAYDGASVRERTIVRDLLKDNVNYNKYIEDNKVLEGMFDQLQHNSKFSALNEQQQFMIMSTMQYLTDKGVAPNNSQEAIDALLEVDENGNSSLLSYIDETNAKLPENKRVVPNSVEDVIPLYKDIIDSYNANREEVETVNKPVEDKPTTSEDSKPTNPIAAFGSQTLEESAESIANVEKEGQRRKKPGAFGVIEENPDIVRGGAEGAPIIDRFRTNSGDEIGNAVTEGFAAIKNSTVFEDHIKMSVRNILGDLADSEYADKEILSQAIMTAANQMEVQIQQGGDDAEKTSSLLKMVATKVSSYKPAVTEAPATPTTTEKAVNDSKRNNAMIGTAEVWRHENSTVGKAYKDYKIDDYLRSGKVDRKTPIMFIADPALINSVKQEVGEIYEDADHLPITAVVEDANGPVEIDGKKYQPIGFLPRTSANTPGAARTQPIREAAVKQQDGTLLKLGDSVIATNGYVRANPPRHLNANEPNNSLIQIMNNDMDATERGLMNDPAVPLPDRQSIYRKYKNKMLSKIRRRGEGTNIHLAYMMPNMKDSNDTEFQLFVTTPENSRSRDGVPLLEVLNSGDAKAILGANSRISRYGKTLQSFFKKSPIKDVRLKNENGTLVPSGAESAAKLTEIASNLEKQLKNYLYLPSGYSYSLTPTEEMNGEQRVYSLNLVSDEGVIPLTTVYNGEVSADNLVEAIRNLMLDIEGNFRKVGTQPLVKYQVNYNDFEGKEGESETAKKGRLSNINDIFDDNILEASKESFNYTIRGVDINSPFKQDGTLTNSTVVANPTNATPAKPINEPAIVATDQVRSGNAIVDSETGAVLEGTPTKVESQVDKVTKAAVTKIINDSKALRLSSDGQTYVDENDKQYARVTHIIQADEEAGEAFNPSSPWITPSTNIGTSIDEFVRDFFAGEFYNDKGEIANDYFFDYPNATQAQWKAFAARLHTLKNTLDAKGLTVIPRDIAVTGTVNVTANDGTQHSIAVAGTLDLLAYDEQGNFHIFDMKTHHSNTISEDKSKKWSRQLSLYQKFLEDKYGIKVASLNIIPIKVDYPAPNTKNQYTVGEGTQLLLNGEEFTGANPNLGQVRAIPSTSINVQYDRLSDSEKVMVETLMPEGKKPAEVTVPESNGPVIDKNTGLARGKVKNWFGNTRRVAPVSPIGTKFSSLAEDVRSAIEARGVTQEKFDSLTEQEKQQLIDCAK